MNKVSCDKCGHEFKPALKEKQGYQFFKCPKCHHEYPVCRISKAGLKIREKLNKERKVYSKMLYGGGNHTRKQIGDQYNKILELEKSFKAEFTPLASKPN